MRTPPSNSVSVLIYGFVKRHREEIPDLQRELDIALSYHAREGNEKGTMLCLWAGADPHARVRDLEYGDDDDPEDEQWSAVDRAVFRGELRTLQRCKPDPARMDFDRLYESANSREVVEFLAEIRAPRDLTRIVRHICQSAGNTWNRCRGWNEALLAVLGYGGRWEVADERALAEIRRDLLKARDWELRDVLQALGRREVCSPEIFQELTRTQAMQKRMLALKLTRAPVKPVSKAEKQRREVANLGRRYDRRKLYEEVWSRPVVEVAKSHGVSGVYLARVCRVLRVPVPPRGYWAKTRSGKTAPRRPLRPLPKALVASGSER